MGAIAAMALGELVAGQQVDAIRRKGATPSSSMLRWGSGSCLPHISPMIFCSSRSCWAGPESLSRRHSGKGCAGPSVTSDRLRLQCLALHLPASQAFLGE